MLTKNSPVNSEFTVTDFIPNVNVMFMIIKFNKRDNMYVGVRIGVLL